MDEEMARRILLTAVLEGRAAELLEHLFNDGTVTVDAQSGRLVFGPIVGDFT